MHNKLYYFPQNLTYSFIITAIITDEVVPLVNKDMSLCTDVFHSIFYLSKV